MVLPIEIGDLVNTIDASVGAIDTVISTNACTGMGLLSSNITCHYIPVDNTPCKIALAIPQAPPST